MLEAEAPKEPLPHTSIQRLSEHVSGIVLPPDGLDKHMSFAHALLYPEVPRLHVAHASEALALTEASGS